MSTSEVQTKELDRVEREKEILAKELIEINNEVVALRLKVIEL